MIPLGILGSSRVRTAVAPSFVGGLEALELFIDENRLPELFVLHEQVAQGIEGFQVAGELVGSPRPGAEHRIEMVG